MNGIRLSNEILDERIRGRNIIRIGDYINSKTKIRFRCLIDGYEWETAPQCVFKGGCPECAGNSKLTNEKLDKKLQERNIKRIENVSGTMSKILFQCTIDDCGYAWKSTPNNILGGQGCPNCAGNIKLTNSILDKRLNGRNIVRVGNYITSLTKISFQCTKDNYVWDAAPSSVLAGSGCPKCAGILKLTDAEVDERLKGRNIKRIGSVKNARAKISFQCDIDCHIWEAVPDSVINRGSGCPKCSGNLRLTNGIIDERLVEKPIKRIGNVIDNATKIKFQCTIKTCNHIWKTTPNKISSGSGCPLCKKKNEGRILKYLSKLYGEKNVKHQHTIYANGRRYSVDFLINNTFIEYQGEQHYNPIEYFGGKEAFIAQVKRDYHIREHCRLNNIKLIEIPYSLSHDKQYELLQNLI